MNEHGFRKETVQGLLDLVPWARDYDGREVEEAVEYLLRRERQRRGEVEPLTGLPSHLALVQGTLLHQHMARSTLRSATSFSGLIIDVRSMRLVNEIYGREAGNELLRQVAGLVRNSREDGISLRAVGDAFANIVVDDIPDRELVAWRESLVADFLTLARGLIEGWTGRAKGDRRWNPQVTVAALNLTVVSPHSWRLLGPLLFDEGDRAYTVERSGPAGVQRRKINLHGLP
jgi:GGDEF domain-containing protein